MISGWKQISKKNAKSIRSIKNLKILKIQRQTRDKNNKSAIGGVVSESTDSEADVTDAKMGSTG